MKQTQLRDMLSRPTSDQFPTVLSRLVPCSLCLSQTIYRIHTVSSHRHSINRSTKLSSSIVGSPRGRTNESLLPLSIQYSIPLSFRGCIGCTSRQLGIREGTLPNHRRCVQINRVPGLPFGTYTAACVMRRAEGSNPSRVVKDQS